MLSQSCLPRKVSLPSGRVAYLQVPTVRQVVEIIGVLQNMEDAYDLSLLFELLSGLSWTGAIDITSQLHKLYHNDPKQIAELLHEMLMQGYDPVEHTETDSEDSDVDDSWKRMISEYCQTMGKDAFTVYNETPFPFFMEMLPEVRRRSAENHINAATENMFAMGGSEKLMNRWQHQAGWIKPKNKTKDISPEQMQRNQEILNKMMKR